MGVSESCRHERREDGRCSVCGHCLHEVVLNGACYLCGATDVRVTVKETGTADFVPASRLKR